MRRIIATILLAVTLGGCSILGPGKDDPAKVESTPAGERFEIVWIDGHKCIVYHDKWGYAGGGGISCDWDRDPDPR